MRKAILILFLAPLMLVSRAQQPIVTARIEPDSIMIGDRFEYVIEVEKDLVQTIVFPEYEKVDEYMELVRSMPIDTLVRNNRSLKIRKRYIMTAFQEGKYSMGVAQVLYADKNIKDTLLSADSLYLWVDTFKIDSTSQSIYDIKPQMGLSFKFAEIKRYVIWSIVGLLLLLVLLYAAKRILAHYGKSISTIFKPVPPQPPHLVAIKALETLHNQKLWQNSKFKLYYSVLTDILRTYIADRYGICAMEMTSDEIVRAMRDIDLPQKSYMDLTAILKDANLVKFAKAEPDAEQNESYYLKAYYFIEETKVVEQIDEEVENEDSGSSNGGCDRGISKSKSVRKEN